MVEIYYTLKFAFVILKIAVIFFAILFTIILFRK